MSLAPRFSVKSLSPHYSPVWWSHVSPQLIAEGTEAQRGQVIGRGSHSSHVGAAGPGRRREQASMLGSSAPLGSGRLRVSPQRPRPRMRQACQHPSSGFCLPPRSPHADTPLFLTDVHVYPLCPPLTRALWKPLVISSPTGAHVGDLRGLGSYTPCWAPPLTQEVTLGK